MRGRGTAKSAAARSPGLEGRATRGGGSRDPALSPGSQPLASSSAPLPPRAPLREMPNAAGSWKRGKKKFPPSASKPGSAQPVEGVSQESCGPWEGGGEQPIPSKGYVENKSAVSCYVCAVWVAACSEEMYVDSPA